MRTRNTTLSILILTVSALLLSVGVRAAPYVNDSRYVYAPVVAVEPIVHVVDVPDRRRECYEEEVTYARGGGGDPGATIVGGLLGAALGNQIGNGSGRTIATAAGAVIGAVAGNQASQRPRQLYRTVEPRCREVVDYYTRQKVVGYNVSYEYLGEIHTTRMDYDPGEQIRLRVTVSPVN